MAILPTTIQEECAALAYSQNTLVVLPTGSGKTIIAACTIQKFLGASENLGKIIIFLAPYRLLAHQQFERIQLYLNDFRVKEKFQCILLTGDSDRLASNNDLSLGMNGIWYWGHPDEWKRLLTLLRAENPDKEEDEDEEFFESEGLPKVFVMTPDKLIHYLTHGFFSIHDVSLLVFDEFHNATGGHPYVKIMQLFYHAKYPNETDSSVRPRVLGLSATPIPVSSEVITDKETVQKNANQMMNLFNSTFSPCPPSTPAESETIDLDHDNFGWPDGVSLFWGAAANISKMRGPYFCGDPRCFNDLVSILKKLGNNPRITLGASQMSEVFVENCLLDPDCNSTLQSFLDAFHDLSLAEQVYFEHVWKIEAQQAEQQCSSLGIACIATLVKFLPTSPDSSTNLFNSRRKQRVELLHNKLVVHFFNRFASLSGLHDKLIHLPSASPTMLHGLSLISSKLELLEKTLRQCLVDSAPEEDRETMTAVWRDENWESLNQNPTVECSSSFWQSEENMNSVHSFSSLASSELISDEERKSEEESQPSNLYGVSSHVYPTIASAAEQYKSRPPYNSKPPLPSNVSSSSRNRDYETSSNFPSVKKLYDTHHTGMDLRKFKKDFEDRDDDEEDWSETRLGYRFSRMKEVVDPEKQRHREKPHTDRLAPTSHHRKLFNLKAALNPTTRENYVERYTKQELLIHQRDTRSSKPPKYHFIDHMTNHSKVRDEESCLCDYSNSNLKCLIFCQNRLETFLVHSYLTSRGISHCAWLTSAVRKQTQMSATISTLVQNHNMRLFKESSVRKPHLKILVCTPVLSEGIDVPFCNCVIRINAVVSVVDNIQTRGRIRQPNVILKPYKVLLTIENETQFSQLEAAENHIRNYLESYTSGKNTNFSTIAKMSIPLFNRVTRASIYPEESKRILYTVLTMLVNDPREFHLRKAALEAPNISDCFDTTAPPMARLPQLQGHARSFVEIVFKLPYRGVHSPSDRRAYECFQAITELSRFGVLDSHFLPPIRNLAEVYRVGRKCKKGELKRYWREMANSLRAQTEVASFSKFARIKGNIHFGDAKKRNDESEAKELPECVDDINYAASPIPSPDDDKRRFILYNHRMLLTPENTESEIVVSGGSFGLGRKLYRTLDTPLPWTRTMEMSLDDEVDFANAEYRILQPLCLLLTSPLPEPFTMLGCHDTRGELIKVSVELNETKPQIHFNYTEMELLSKFKHLLLLSLGITNFIDISTKDCLSMEGGAAVQNIQSPFLMFAPMLFNEVCVDWNYIVEFLRLSFMMKGNLSEFGPSFPFISEMYNAEKLLSRIPLVQEPDYSIITSEVTKMMDLDNNNNNNTISEHFSAKELLKLVGNRRYRLTDADDVSFNLTTDSSIVEERCIALLQSRGYEPPIVRLCYDQKRSYRFASLRGILPHSRVDEVIADDLAAQYRKFNRIISNVPYYMVVEPVRQGPKQFFCDSLHKPSGKLGNIHPPNFARLVPITDPIFQQVGCIFPNLDLLVALYCLSFRYLELQLNQAYLLKEPLMKRIVLSSDYVSRSLTAPAARIGTHDIELKDSLKRLRFEADYCSSALKNDNSSSPLENVLSYEPPPPPTLKQNNWNSQRLEFLGDAVLKALSAIGVFFSNPGVTSQYLTEYSTKLKSNSFLEECSKSERFFSYLWASPFAVRSHGNVIGTLSMLRQQDISSKMHADIVEALIAAIYLSNYFNVSLFPCQTDCTTPTSFISSLSPSEVCEMDRAIALSTPRPQPTTDGPLIKTENFLTATSQPYLSAYYCKHDKATRFGHSKSFNLLGSTCGLYATAVFLDRFVCDSEQDCVVPVFDHFKDRSKKNCEEFAPATLNSLYSRLYQDEMPVAPLTMLLAAAQSTDDVEEAPLELRQPELIALSCDAIQCYSTIIDEKWLKQHSLDGVTIALNAAVCNAFADSYEWKNPGIVTIARTHPAAVGWGDLSKSYDRLEFLGDSILSLLLTEWLYEEFYDFREGTLSALKSVLQSNTYLTRKVLRRCARNGTKCSNLLIHSSAKFYESLVVLDDLQGATLEHDECTDFISVLQEIKTKIVQKHQNFEISESYSQYKFVADIYESVLGALFVDSNFDLKAVWKYISPDFECVKHQIDIMIHQPDGERRLFGFLGLGESTRF